MKPLISRRTFLALLAALLVCWWSLTDVVAQVVGGLENKKDRRRREGDDYALPSDLADLALISAILGRAGDRSITVSTLTKEALECCFEYGTGTGNYSLKTSPLTLEAGKPKESVLDNLQPDTEYFYRLRYRRPGEERFQARPECCFHTQRSPGSAFRFCVQGDSHPERSQMSDPDLYARTLRHAASGKPDFYACMGDDFSVDQLRTVTEETVSGRYTLQRPLLGLVAQTASLYLVNGNHEQASLFNFNQSDVRHDVAVWAQTARNRYFPMPAPDGCYTGDSEPLKPIGPLRDYYAWTWGDALFVVLDCYWHSSARVDNPFREKPGDGGNDRDANKDRDWWGITLGDAQYKWFKQTLAKSTARYKFVFAHHVLGTGRGGTDESDLYEWGGKDRRGRDEFATKRPGWDLPIHQLMVKHGVTIFFQGHDHLYVRQERDGVVYQEVPMPADQGYVAYNEDRYQTGVKHSNSGYLRVDVSPERAKVDYVRCYLPKDETDKRKTGDVAYSYEVKPKADRVRTSAPAAK